MKVRFHQSMGTSNLFEQPLKSSFYFPGHWVKNEVHHATI